MRTSVWLPRRPRFFGSAFIHRLASREMDNDPYAPKCPYIDLIEWCLSCSSVPKRQRRRDRHIHRLKCSRTLDQIYSVVSHFEQLCCCFCAIKRHWKRFKAEAHIISHNTRCRFIIHCQRLEFHLCTTHERYDAPGRGGDPLVAPLQRQRPRREELLPVSGLQGLPGADHRGYIYGAWRGLPSRAGAAEEGTLPRWGGQVSRLAMANAASHCWEGEGVAGCG